MDDQSGFEITGLAHDRLTRIQLALLVQLILYRGASAHGDRAAETGAKLKIMLGVVDERVHIDVGDVIPDEPDNAVIDLKGCFFLECFWHYGSALSECVR